MQQVRCDDGARIMAIALIREIFMAYTAARGSSMSAVVIQIVLCTSFCKMCTSF